MEQSTYEKIIERSKETDGKFWQNRLKNYSETDEPTLLLQTSNFEELQAVVERISGGSELTLVALTDRYDERRQIKKQKVDDLHVLLNRVGDIGSGTADFPNDFTVNVELDLSKNDRLMIEHTLEECPILCNECYRNQEVDQMYSCDHNEGEYDYIYDYKMAIFNPKVSSYHQAMSTFWINL
jgi:hypothetical protein